MSIGPAAASFVTAACPTGKVPLGGGYELLGTGPSLTVLTAGPHQNGTVGWRVAFRNGTTSVLNNAQVKVHVVCAAVQ
jgi:hypothetical protein